MKPLTLDQEAKKTAMTALRTQRKASIAAASSTMKTQKKEMTAILEVLKSQAATIPEIAQQTDLPTDKTLWYLATMKKYGQIVEAQKEGAFFKYTLNESKKKHEKTEV